MRSRIGYGACHDAASPADRARGRSDAARSMMAHLHHTASGADTAWAAQRLAVLDILDLTGRLFRDMHSAAAKQCTACSKGCQFCEGHTN